MECEVCKSEYNLEVHHCFFRSQSKWLKNVEINHKHLCPEHHRGNTGPHMNKQVDNQYKLEVQTKLFELFSEKNYFTEKEIKDKLKYTPSEAMKFVKTLKLHKEGFDKVDIIQKLQGGRFYAK